MYTPATGDRLLSRTKIAELLGIDPTTVDQILTPSATTPAGRRYYLVSSVREQLAVHSRADVPAPFEDAAEIVGQS